MNDELKSLITRVLVVALTALAAKLHGTPDAGTLTFITAIATDVADAAVLVWSTYSHWGMKKVPVAAKATVDGTVVSMPGDTKAAAVPAS